MSEVTKFNGITYNSRHGGPFDRGSADSWYSRPINPHYYTGGTGTSTMIEVEDMSQSEIEDYMAGYEYNELHGGKKSWD